MASCKQNDRFYHHSCNSYEMLMGRGSFFAPYRVERFNLLETLNRLFSATSCIHVCVGCLFTASMPCLRTFRDFVAFSVMKRTRFPWRIQAVVYQSKTGCVVGLLRCVRLTRWSDMFGHALLKRVVSTSSTRVDSQPPWGPVSACWSWECGYSPPMHNKRITIPMYRYYPRPRLRCWQHMRAASLLRHRQYLASNYDGLSPLLWIRVQLDVCIGT